MHDNPAADWQSLAEHYRSMYDEELENLADDFGNLTETAQQVLRSELSNRGLPAPGEKPAVSRSPQSPTPRNLVNAGDPEDNAGGMRGDETGPEGAEEAPKAFTWKTQLCTCETTEQARGICEMLKRAGIESWLETPGSRWSTFEPRVVVAADRLDEAVQIARQPIPQDILDDLRIEAPEYVPPRCPACHAEDPVLESAEPTNSWLCEVCGKQWTEPAIDAMDVPEKTGR